MGNFEASEFVNKDLKSPEKIALLRFGVDLSNDHAVLAKLMSLGGKMPDVADLANLWGDFQKQNREEDGMKKAA